MKVWNGYGTEHSMNLVMIGKFKNAMEASEAETKICKLTDDLRKLIDIDSSDGYSEEVIKALSEINCHTLSPKELENFLFDFHLESEGEKIVITSEESEVSAFLKVMIDLGAKVEVFSAHHYPDENYGRRK